MRLSVNTEILVTSVLKLFDKIETLSEILVTRSYNTI